MPTASATSRSSRAPLLCCQPGSRGKLTGGKGISQLLYRREGQHIPGVCQLHDALFPVQHCAKAVFAALAATNVGEGNVILHERQHKCSRHDLGAACEVSQQRGLRQVPDCSGTLDGCTNVTYAGQQILLVVQHFDAMPKGMSCV